MARVRTRDRARVRTTATHLQAELSLDFGRGSSQMLANARVRARERLVAEIRTIRAPITPKDVVLLSCSALSRTSLVSFGTSRVSAIWSLALPTQVAVRIRIGNTEVKNCAATDIDRSKSSIRATVAAIRSSTRPGQRSGSRSATRRTLGGIRAR